MEARECDTEISTRPTVKINGRSIRQLANAPGHKGIDIIEREIQALVRRITQLREMLAESKRQTAEAKGE